MGQTLSEPVVEKHTSFGEDDTLVFGISEMQGWRISMEDAHATVLALDAKTGDEKTSFFAVYDGHGGSTVAKYTGETLHRRLADSAEYKSGDYEKALKAAFLGTDEDLRNNPEFANDPSGCTAVAALLVAGPAPEAGSDKKVARRIIVANAGDSRSVLSVKGEAKAMSYDHKPSNREENTRIVSAGGFVEYGRVNGNLALSRAIGDFEFKQNFSLEPEAQIVTADPEIISHDVDGEEEFLVLACDGIWDCLSSQQVVDLVRRGIAKGKTMQEICEDAMDRCLAPDSEIGGVGCDNMTICVVALLGGRTKEEWYAWVKERVENKVGWETPEEIAPVFNVQPGAQGQGQGGPMTIGRLGAMGGGSVLSALAGGLGADDEDGPGLGGLRLPAGLAGALGGAGIVFRPGNQTDEHGGVMYEAHVVDDDDSDGDDDESSAAASSTGAKVEELNDEGAAEGAKRASDADGKDERPELQHQPEIVESPRTGASPASATNDSDVKVDVRPSTEGDAKEASA